MRNTYACDADLNLYCLPVYMVLRLSIMCCAAYFTLAFTSMVIIYNNDDGWWW